MKKFINATLILLASIWTCPSMPANASGDYITGGHTKVRLSAFFEYVAPESNWSAEIKGLEYKFADQSYVDYMSQNHPAHYSKANTQIIKPNKRLSINEAIELPLGKSEIVFNSSIATSPTHFMHIQTPCHLDIDASVKGVRLLFTKADKPLKSWAGGSPDNMEDFYPYKCVVQYSKN